MSEKHVDLVPFSGLLPDPDHYNIAREGRHFLHVHAFREGQMQRVSIRIFRLVLVKLINKRAWAEIT